VLRFTVGQKSLIYPVQLLGEAQGLKTSIEIMVLI
jgi:hypothetical protein